MEISLKLKVITSVSLFVGFIGFPASLILKCYFFVIPSLLLGFLPSLLFLLECKLERIIKGFLIILFGTFWGILLPDTVDEYIPEFLEKNMTIFKYMAIFACSGAGGSIIASHSEQRYREDEEKKVERAFVDKTKNIEELIISVENLKRMAFRIHVAYGVAIFIGFVVLFASF